MILTEAKVGVQLKYNTIPWCYLVFCRVLNIKEIFCVLAEVPRHLLLKIE